MTEKPVIVIGAGLAGLACGVALTDAGIPVSVFEGATAPGGRASSCLDAASGERVDIGPHVLTSEHRNMLALLKRLGTREHVLWQPERFITLVDNGRAVPMRNYRLPAPLHFLPNFFRVERLSAADVLSARRVLWRVMRLAEDDVLALDDRVAEDVLREAGVSERFIDWFWRTVCMAIMNVPLERCSAGSLLRFLQMMAAHNDFHFGFPKVPLADLFVDAAMRVIRAGGGEVRTGAPVAALRTTSGRVGGIRLADGSSRESTQVVAAVPPAALAALQARSGLAVPPVANLDWFAPSPYVSTWLWFSRRLTRERFWARVWSPQNVNYDFYDLANIRERAAPGSLIAANAIFSERVGKMTDRQIIDATLRELRERFPGATHDAMRHARVHRISMAITAPHPGFEARRPSSRTRLPGLYLAGDWTRTALPESMESAVRSGFLAAEAVAAERGVALGRAMPRRPPQGLTRLVNAPPFAP